MFPRDVFPQGPKPRTADTRGSPVTRLRRQNGLPWKTCPFKRTTLTPAPTPLWSPGERSWGQQPPCHQEPTRVFSRPDSARSGGGGRECSGFPWNMSVSKNFHGKASLLLTCSGGSRRRAGSKGQADSTRPYSSHATSPHPPAQRPGITLNITHATCAQVLTVAPQVRTESSLAGTVPFPPPCQGLRPPLPSLSGAAHVPRDRWEDALPSRPCTGPGRCTGTTLRRWCRVASPTSPGEG